MKQPCGCCSGIEIATPQSEYNRPDLPALSYRVGTYPTFFETMLARLSNISLDIPSDDGSGAITHLTPLKALTARQPDDPSIALLDAWSVVADVLTFYQERIANEGYLGTAIERRSVLELARLIGYKLRPGVSASVYLSLTTAAGFAGEIPVGTRAQSIPAAGENAQFFETADPLQARDTWNALKPRLVRPQIITPPPDPSLGIANHLGTNADVVDSLFLDGISTNLKPGDALLISVGDRRNQQFLRFAEGVDAEAAQSRTRVSLQEDLSQVQLADTLQRFLMDTTAGFDGSDLARQAAQIVQSLLSPAGGTVHVTGDLRNAIPPLRTLQSVAAKRGFVRLAPWFDHLLQILNEYAGGSGTFSLGGARILAVAEAPDLTNYAVSGLDRLQQVVAPLLKPASVQPANSLVLARSVSKAFAAQSDMVPRLLSALKFVAVPALYRAWSAVQPNPLQLEILAVRAKATLFAASYNGASKFNRTTGVTTFTAPTLQSAWGALIPANSISSSVIVLDAVYDQIKRGSWIVVETPDPANARNFAKVASVQTRVLDTATGFSAKVTLLTLDRPWLSANTADAFKKLVGDTSVLRETVVYAQTETLDLAEEPLDRDIGGASIELDGLYDGLEPGRWIIVSGARTDVPNVTGLKGSELVMISAVTQGKGKELCRPLLPKLIPFDGLFYISDANSDGDRLVVGHPTSGFESLLQSIDRPDFVNQEFCEAVQLSPGLYAGAYIPSDAERKGDFSAFASALIDPAAADGGVFPGGLIPNNRRSSVFAWRIRNIASGAEKVHTTLQLANSLAYTYDSGSVTIHGNVVKATHGQTVGEVLGDGDATEALQEFALRQSPLTYLSAPTPSGAASTLVVSVNEIQWHEADDLGDLKPADHGFSTRTSDDDKVSIIFGNGVHGARLPSGNSNVKATYRYGIGSAGNVKAGQISQLATHPLGAQGVINPLAASGGADRDSLDQGRSNAPTAVLALDRLVSVQDYADFARTFAGIGKASSIKLSDGRRQLVHLTIAGAGDIPIDGNSDLYRNLVAALSASGDPHQAFQLCVRRVKLMVIGAGIALRPDYQWTSVAPIIRAALLDHFGFDRRDLGQSAYLSEATALMQSIQGVDYLNITTFDAVNESTTVAELAKLAATLELRQAIPARLAQLNPLAASSDIPCVRVVPAELVFLTPEIPDTLILSQLGA